jgi:hypothetical protein
VAVVLEAGVAAQHGDGGSAGQDAFVLGVAQFVDALLLLRQQALAQDRRRSGGNAVIERTLAPQVGDVRGADHDLGRYAADIDAGTAEGAALDQRDARSLLDGLQRRRHRRAAAADHSDVQMPLCIVRASARRLTLQPSVLVQQVRRLARHVGKPAPGNRVQTLRRPAAAIAKSAPASGRDFSPPLRIGHRHRAHTGHLLQSLPDVLGARSAGHAVDVQCDRLGHGTCHFLTVDG